MTYATHALGVVKFLGHGVGYGYDDEQGTRELPDLRSQLRYLLRSGAGCAGEALAQALRAVCGCARIRPDGLLIG